MTEFIKLKIFHWPQGEASLSLQRNDDHNETLLFLQKLNSSCSLIVSRDGFFLAEQLFTSNHNKNVY